MRIKLMQGLTATVVGHLKKKELFYNIAMKKHANVRHLLYDEMVYKRYSIFCWGASFVNEWLHRMINASIVFSINSYLKHRRPSPPRPTAAVRCSDQSRIAKILGQNIDRCYCKSFMRLAS